VISEKFFYLLERLECGIIGRRWINEVGDGSGFMVARIEDTPSVHPVVRFDRTQFEIRGRSVAEQFGQSM